MVSSIRSQDLSSTWPEEQNFSQVFLSTGDLTLDSAFRIALGDIVGNIIPFQDGLLPQPEYALMAGLDYTTPWTRDTAINTWNGVGILYPRVTYHTLLSVLKREHETVLIGGQYWDAIIWSIGAWSQYLSTGDRDFLALSFAATRDSLLFFEQQEFDTTLSLFRGPAVYGDGVAAYPDRYAQTERGSSSILDWPASHRQDASQPGFGLPMHTLSTNCVYYQAYVVLEQMATELGLPVDPVWKQKAQQLKRAINEHFWNPATGTYRYLVDAFGNSEEQEGMGLALALLFGVADREQVAAILRNHHGTEQGFPCIWPPFERYSRADGQSFGRHCGVIWPHIQGLWAHAVAEQRRADLFAHELYTLAQHAYRDSQFAEIYHPLTGVIYGGLQEGHHGNTAEHLARPSGHFLEWKSCSRQTWSASAYLRMILMGLFGLHLAVDGITFQPLLPPQLHKIRLSGLPYRAARLTIEVERSAAEPASFVNGQAFEHVHLPTDIQGDVHILLKVS
ncbi:MGH1-like glycoside hydrolase domain-containing protein [Tengunoibacter tsumagoiensis]|uniref:Mannosylglycerate hydrolase MGH1-like glycoside hydrolase domain-containing protein n=1 Tax=Tengunoibacter tsumagoiensis TaxID=2014871 RepID=A0A402AAN6_9CHLR|nr:hypothetical protein [Tengunoibacter tsumagoiensis]GCE16106.1 hypothetical protein KTT_59650 [Tengunoibacter tsumagoiensis]